jgi:ubiquinone/menaquinone biosynthesis C-methylase UbiE
MSFGLFYRVQKDVLGKKIACAIIFYPKVELIVNSFYQRLRSFQRKILDSLVRCFAHQALEARAEKFTQLFENQIPERSLILDLGGGWGFYAEPLKRRGHEHLILDVVNPAYQKAPVVLYDGTKIPFPDQSFDVTVLVTMLHHVIDPESLFREVDRVTRKKVVVIEDLYHHPIGRFWTICRDRLLNMEFMDHPHQFRKHEEWSDFFKKLKFKVVSFKEIYTWLAGFRILNGIYILERG